MRAAFYVLVAGLVVASGCVRNKGVAAVPTPVPARVAIACNLIVQPASVDGRTVEVVVSMTDPQALDLEMLPQTCPEHFEETLTLVRHPPAFSNQQPEAVAGDHEITQGKLIFRPSAPLIAGEAYMATFSLDACPTMKGKSLPVTVTYVVPAEETPASAAKEAAQGAAHN